MSKIIDDIYLVPCGRKHNAQGGFSSCTIDQLCPHCQEIAALRRKVTVREMERDHARVRWDEACEGKGAKGTTTGERGGAGRPVDTEAAKEYKAWATYPLT